MQIFMLTFNDFAENTYILADGTRECVIIDPGCYSTAEEQRLHSVITGNDLKPVRLINTHCHLDHIFGINFVKDTYGLELEIHEGELPLLSHAEQIGQMYGIAVDPVDPPTTFLREGDTVRFGTTSLKVLFTPGHSPASICLYDSQSKQVIVGDVLFQGSIGRTDLPGGDYETLIRSIREKLLVLPDDVDVYSGHGPQTTIGAERATNPFLQG